jgi:hypothetical protein
MANQILYQVPYEVTVKAADLKSGKPVSNNFYMKSGTAVGAPPAYGAAVPGASLTVFLTNFRTSYATLRALLSVNYKVLEYQARSMIGKKTTAPSNPIASLVSSLTAIVGTSVPHGLSTGAIVTVHSVTAPAAVNGNWVITVMSPTSFSLDGSAPFATWSGDGFWQVAGGKQEILYGDIDSLPAADLGGVSGEAIALFASASVRRRNTGVGRNFRSRLSFSPIGESAVQDGKFTSAAATAWDTALNTYLFTSIENGATDPGMRIMYDLAVSKTLALGLPTPFTQSTSWTRFTTTFSLQPNNGSIVRRKPRLTAPVS